MTYLGLRPHQLAAGIAASIILGLGLQALAPEPTFAPECGYVIEEGAAIPASCMTEQETAERLAAIRNGRASAYFNGEAESAYAECAAMLAADDWDAGTCWTEWPDLEAVARAIWGPDGDPETGPNR